MGWAFGAATLGMLIAGFFFGESLLICATGLTTIALIFEMNELLIENRDAIWIHRRSSWEANGVLIIKIVAIFLGVLATSLVLQTLWPQTFFLPAAGHGVYFQNEPLTLFKHNLRVLMACLLMALIYRSAGVLLVICWNAFNWSMALNLFIRSAAETGAKHTWFYALAVLPHLVLEAAAYIAAGLTGVFLSKALFKYRLSSGKFYRVSRASVAILAVSIGSLWLAMELEIGLAQSVLTQLRH
jgi:hypothetical protein